MLSENDIKEELSLAYIHAVAARAGFSCEGVRKDRDSVDVHVCARGRLHPESRVTSPMLAVQVKATVIDPVPDGSFDFRLSIKNYDDLRRRSLVPRILVVFAMPQDPATWLTLSEDQLILKRCAYFCPLLGAPAPTHEKYEQIRIQRGRVLTGEALHDLMVRVSRQEEIAYAS